MPTHSTAQVVVERAPAKLNLFFEVLKKRADGYHEIESLMLALALADQLHLRGTPGPGISLRCAWGANGGYPREALPVDERNLVVRALLALQRASGSQAGAEVELWKRIPSAAGLGGGSSDAAAALRGANILWNLHWPAARLAEVGAEIGSDVPFFLLNSPAIVSGRGERVQAVNNLPILHVVIVKPVDGLSTADVYRACHPALAPYHWEGLLSCLRQGSVGLCGRHLHNRLQIAAESLSPWPRRLQTIFAGLDLCGHLMSGSGTSYFGICRTAAHARHVAARLKARQLGEVFVTRTITER